MFYVILLHKADLTALRIVAMASAGTGALKTPTDNGGRELGEWVPMVGWPKDREKRKTIKPWCKVK